MAFPAAKVTKSEAEDRNPERGVDVAQARGQEGRVGWNGRWIKQVT